MENLLNFFNNINIVSYLFFLTLFGIILLISSHKIPIIQYITVIVIPILFIHKNINYYFNFIITNNDLSTKPIEFFHTFAIEFRYTKISSIFLIMVGILWLMNNLYSIGYLRIKDINLTHFISLIFASILCVVLIACSWNLFTLFIFYELLTFITYFLVSYDNTIEAKAAGIKYFSVLFISSTCFFLTAIGIIYGFSDNLSFDKGGILSSHFQFSEFWYLSAIALLLFLYGCSKASTLPLHFWLPEAMIAHTPVSALLHAVAVVKSGIIALLFIIIYIFGLEFLQQLQSNHPIVFQIPKYIAGLSALYCSVIAMSKLKLKKVLAYSTIGQLGYMVMIVFSFHDQMPQVLILHLIAHGIAKINMFFIAGFLYLKYKIKKTDEIHGIWKYEKIVSICFAISTLSIIGIPPTIGMISKFNIIVYGVRNEELFIIGVILLGTILNCYYFLPILIDMFFGITNEKAKQIEMIEDRIKKYFNLLYLPIVIVAVLVVALFFIPYKILL